MDEMKDATGAGRGYGVAGGVANAIKELETPFNEAEKLKELRERLEFVNAELSKDSGQPNYINESETEAEVEIEAEPI